eukprot:4842807-Lingulodinium_polyedra.AAC.1
MVSVAGGLGDKLFEQFFFRSTKLDGDIFMRAGQAEIDSEIAARAAARNFPPDNLGRPWYAEEV